MAEANLRSLLVAARGGQGSGSRQDAPVGDAEMAAILGVLRNDQEPAEPIDGDGTAEVTEAR